MIRFIAILLLAVSAFGQSPSPFKPGTFGPAELKFVNGVPVLRVAGSPEAMGEQIAELVGKHSPDPTPILHEFLKAAKVEKAFPTLKLMARGLKPGCPDHHRREIETISKATGFELDLLLFINTAYDLHSGMGCSTFVVEHERSATGSPIFGRNFDWLASKGLPQQAMVVAYKPDGKRAFAIVTLAPISGAISGMNDAGLAIAINAIHLNQTSDQSNFDAEGTPMLLLFRQILEECNSVEEVDAFLKKSRRTTSACLTVCDARGGGVFEITPKNIVRRSADRGVTCCTNHFCTELAKGERKCWRIDKLLAARAIDGKIGVDEVFSTLHAVNQKQSTIQSMVFEPKERILHLKLGDGKTTATESKAARIDLTELLK